MAGRKSWTITGVDEQARAEVVAVAERAGMPVHEWIEQAVHQALQPGQVGKDGRKPTATRPLLPRQPSRLPRQAK